MNYLKTIIILAMFFVTSFANADLSGNLLVPQEEMQFAKDYLNQIRERNFEFVLSHIDPEIADEVNQQKLEDVAAYFPAGKLLSMELMGSQVHTINSTWQGNFSFEYQFESGWAVANVVMKRVDNKTTVIGFNVYRTENSQKELNKFELFNKTALHYLVLILACVVPVFIFVTLFYCIKTPIAKRKWLWILFVPGGIGTISLNWTTGMYEFKVLTYLLFGTAGGSASDFAPRIVSAGFPLGAIIFWLKRNLFIEQSKASGAILQNADETGDSI